MNKNINEILTEIATKGSIYNDIIDNIRTQQDFNKDALISEIAISFIKNKDKIENLYNTNQLKYWFVKVVLNQVKSTTSPYHKNNKQTLLFKLNYNPNESFDYFDVQIDDTDVDGDLNDNIDIEDKLQEELQYIALEEARKVVDQDVSWFEQQMFIEYYDHNKTYRAIEAEYGIDHCLAFISVKKYRNKLNKVLKEKQIL
jgi:hypothetical protein